MLEDAIVRNANTSKRSDFTEALECFSKQSHFWKANFHIVPITEATIKAPLKVYGSLEKHGNLASRANFARFYLHELLPGHVDKVLYVDVDIIVQANIAPLWQEEVVPLHRDDKLLAAVPRTAVPLQAFISSVALGLYLNQTNHAMDPLSPSFNAGLYLLNLRKWRERNFVTQAEYWMRENTKQKLWTLGTQPVLHMLAYDDWIYLPSLWNLDGLGYRKNFLQKTLVAAHALHWSGASKPWDKSNKYHQLWARYDAPVCSSALLLAHKS